VALRDGSQAKAMNKILPKLQALHKNIIWLPWSVYYKDLIYTSNASMTTKRKISSCSSPPPKDNIDSSIAEDSSDDSHTPEKVPRISRG